jgi:competence protein ComFC
LFITLLLVDDVMTTGATMNECGKVLLESGANRIYAATVALADF